MMSPSCFLRDRFPACECCALLVALFLWLLLAPAQGQSDPIPAGDSGAPSQGLPTINSGPGYGFTQLDFAQMYLDQQNKHAKAVEEQRKKDQMLVQSGVVSALDLAAPNSAIQEFNRATSLLKAQDSKEASKHLEKAIHAYPKFVSAYIALGLAYADQSDPRAKSEFQTASQLDPKFPAGFLNLGLLAFPLRLALVIDTSGSVLQRFGFEKHAAEKFLEKVLNGTSDLGFVAGFNTDTVVTQDFSPDPQKLGRGVEELQNAGGTALFDAISLATWKLAAYPEQQRVARVVVVLTDGEDNSSHRSLKQVLHDAEEAGVTIYPVSTKETSGPKTDADRVLDVLAERTGGESMFPGDVLSLNNSLEKLRDLIRSRYLLAYRPSNFEPNGQYHPVVITAEKDGKRLRVHSRRGYYARLEAGHN